MVSHWEGKTNKYNHIMPRGKAPRISCYKVPPRTQSPKPSRLRATSTRQHCSPSSPSPPIHFSPSHAYSSATSSHFPDQHLTLPTSSMPNSIHSPSNSIIDLEIILAKEHSLCTQVCSPVHNKHSKQRKIQTTNQTNKDNTNKLGFIKKHANKINHT